MPLLFIIPLFFLYLWLQIDNYLCITVTFKFNVSHRIQESYINFPPFYPKSLFKNQLIIFFFNWFFYFMHIYNESLYFCALFFIFSLFCHSLVTIWRFRQVWNHKYSVLNRSMDHKYSNLVNTKYVCKIPVKECSVLICIYQYQYKSFKYRI